MLNQFHQPDQIVDRSHYVQSPLHLRSGYSVLQTNFRLRVVRLLELFRCTTRRGLGGTAQRGTASMGLSHVRVPRYDGTRFPTAERARHRSMPKAIHRARPIQRWYCLQSALAHHRVR